jgi:hypothetical protein
MAVVDPHSNWGERPRTCDDEVQFPVPIDVAGNDPQSPSLAENLEGTPVGTSAKIKINSVLEAIRPPAFCLGDGEVKLAIAIQIGNCTALVAERRYGGKLCG